MQTHFAARRPERVQAGASEVAMSDMPDRALLEAKERDELMQIAAALGVDIAPVPARTPSTARSLRPTVATARAMGESDPKDLSSQRSPRKLRQSPSAPELRRRRPTLTQVLSRRRRTHGRHPLRTRARPRRTTDAPVGGWATPIAVMSTAHPAKFGEAVLEATGSQPELPPALAALAGRDEYVTVLPNDLASLREFVTTRCSH